MSLFAEYREGVHEALDEFPDFTPVKKLGLAVLTIASIHSEKALERRIDGYVVVESVATGWYEDSDEQLEQELKEILDEPKSAS